MSETQAAPARMNPLVAVAAVAVTLFSLVGMGVMTGVIPTSNTTSQQPAPVAAVATVTPVAPTPPAPAATPAPVAVAPAPAAVSAPAPTSTPAPAPIAVSPAPAAVSSPMPPSAPAPKVVHTPAPRPVYRPRPTVAAAVPDTQSQSTPTYPAAYDTPPATRSRAPYPPVVAQAPAERTICNTCGRIENVSVVQQAGEGSGLGAIAGGVAGALLGNRVGRGTGRKVATVAAAAGGAFAGHQVEKHVKSSKRYDVTVRMEDGSVRSFPFDNEPSFQSGDRVRVVDGKLHSDN